MSRGNIAGVRICPWEPPSTIYRTSQCIAAAAGGGHAWRYPRRSEKSAMGGPRATQIYCAYILLRIAAKSIDIRHAGPSKNVVRRMGYTINKMTRPCQSERPAASGEYITRTVFSLYKNGRLSHTFIYEKIPRLRGPVRIGSTPSFGARFGCRRWCKAYGYVPSFFRERKDRGAALFGLFLQRMQDARTEYRVPARRPCEAQYNHDYIHRYPAP